MSAWAGLFAASAAVFFAAVMLLSRSLYVSAVSLLVVLLHTGALFFLCGAPLLGFLQVMIYAGAVMVLVVVTIMATGGGREGERFARFAFPRPLAWAALACAAAELAWALWRGRAPSAGGAVGASTPLGEVLFGRYALGTEAVTLLMFLAALAIAPEKEAA